jgi:hypothetical protein
MKQAMTIRRSRWITLGCVVLVVGFFLTARYCRPDYREAIRVDEGRVVVTNLTGTEWTGVEIWLNNYYRAQTERLLPNQRLEVPLHVFVAGYGQKFQAHLHKADGIEVTARGANGERITLTWGTGRRR